LEVFVGARKSRMPHGDASSRIEYSDRYTDGVYSYRHVICPKEISRHFPKDQLMSENEWRSFQIQQSRGWQHYAIHKPEPHILLFRRPIGTDPVTGRVDPVRAREERAKYEQEYGLPPSDENSSAANNSNTSIKEEDEKME